ncbi:helix-turn-helix DNA binding protein [Gordonia phage Lilbeanie]|uniref:Helix-turn-helix DNA binding protein n=1 Tax=Gordonia phage Lilbeanie TaxID=2794947 RepID=A0A7T1KSE8_9CAUD|nr:helix-turn-helix DNA binding protein [Gordonia phage Lilbeanie]QPO17133.1 helix-turn-helix DNA binding protein [Gordonia phage Lilbeanie]
MTAATPAQPVDPRLIALDDAAAYLGGIHTDTVNSLAQQRTLTKVKIGRRSFITRESLDAYVDRLIADQSPPEDLPVCEACGQIVRPAE